MRTVSGEAGDASIRRLGMRSVSGNTDDVSITNDIYAKDKDNNSNLLVAA